MPSPSGPPVYELGEFATLWMGSTQLVKIRLESVSIGSAAPSSAPSPGLTEVNFELHYDGFAAFAYGPDQWRARDAAGATYAATTSANDPLLVGGTLAPGENVNGWVGFIVPEGTPRLWLDFLAGQGQLIFSIGPIRSLP